ncbi:MAG: DUF1553 domain-containing protein [Candidatus Omnitrophica bacterium]|nr:DUF1553 domain-containing protein [Candidatus Omnitrophota bacterium]
MPDRRDEKDPTNQWIHRIPVKRLEAELVRDAILAVSGQLDRSVGGPSVKPFLTPYGFVAVDPPNRVLSMAMEDAVCTDQYPEKLSLPMFLPSIFPRPTRPLANAESLNVPALRALTLLNNEFVVEQAANGYPVQRLWPPGATGIRRVKIRLDVPSGPWSRTRKEGKTELARSISGGGSSIQGSGLGGPRLWIFNLSEFIFGPLVLVDHDPGMTNPSIESFPVAPRHAEWVR